MRQSDGLLRRVAAVTTAFAVVAGVAVAVSQGMSSAGDDRDNLLDHSGFRMGGEGWDVRSTAQVDVRRTSPGALGSRYALRLTPSATADVTLVDQRQGLPSAKNDALYRAIAYVRTDQPKTSVALRLSELRGADVVGSRRVDFTLDGGGWQRLVIRYQAQAGDTELQLAVGFPELAKDTRVFVDHLRIYAVEAPDRGDNTPDNPNPPSRGDSGTLFGASVYQGSQSWEAAVAASDQRFGRHEVIRVFHPGLPNAWPGRSGSVGRPVVVSFKAPPAQVVAGNHDDELLSWFRNAPRDRTIWWSYWHEPEDDVKSGSITAQQWREAYRRIAGLAARADNPMLRSTVILMCWTANPNSGRSLNDFFPGRDVVDTIGWDCYNKSDSYLDPQTMFARAIAASRNFGVGFGIAELGSKLRGGDSNGAERAAWLRRVGAHLAGEGAEFVTYFDSLVPGGDFRLDAAGQQAWRDVVDS